MHSSFGLMGLAGSGKDTTAKILREALLRENLGDFELRAFAAPLKDFTMDVFGLTPSAVYDHVLKEQEFKVGYDKRRFINRAAFELDAILAEYCESTGLDLITVEDRIAEKLGVPGNEDILLHLSNKLLEVLADDTCKPSWIRSKLRGVLGDTALTFKTTPRSILQKIGTEFFRGYVSESFWTDIAPRSGVIMTDVRFANELEYIRGNGGVIIKIVNENQRDIKNSGHASEQLVYTATPDITLVHDGVNLQSIASKVDAIVYQLKQLKDLGA